VARKLERPVRKSSSVNLLWSFDVLASERVGEPSDEDLMLNALPGDRLAVAALVDGISDRSSHICTGW
jgi:hypothetical protein